MSLAEMRQKILNKVSHFFSTNSHLRKIRSFYRRFFSGFRKILLIALAVAVAALLLLYWSKPTYLKKKYDQISSRFLYHLNFENRSFSKINVSGNKRVASEDVIAIVKKVKAAAAKEQNSGDYTPLIQNIIDELKSGLPWIDQLVVSRSVPDILNIAIVEYQPFAIWQNDNKKYIIDKDGNAVPFVDSEEFRDMIILSGADANLNAKSLFNIFTIDPELSANVYSATWVGNRRFDIRFSNGLLIKLPEKNISKAWQRLIEIYKTPGSLIGLKFIDLRVEDKVYLKYDDAVNKEIQKL